MQCWGTERAAQISLSPLSSHCTHTQCTRLEWGHTWRPGYKQPRVWQPKQNSIIEVNPDHFWNPLCLCIWRQSPFQRPRRPYSAAQGTQCIGSGHQPEVTDVATSTDSQFFLLPPAHEVFFLRAYFPAGLDLGLRTLVLNPHLCFLPLFIFF